MASLILVRNVVGELRPKRTLAASRGFLAAARLSCLFVIFVLLLLLSLSLFALVSYFVLLICYSAIRLLSCVEYNSVSVSLGEVTIVVDACGQAIISINFF